ncbi:helix-turn-helix transcriptional regulator [Paenibacillus eucommiae]|uniref:DNA-binding CsgD family transcriptional regulator n=1 Tax=Paenibacillus eucommiae TaxID=1355755 RepID=A0ABS4INK0_9BACL|nr:helix-turn-helix transcriptional regulator [Paenibacillus eucommiae]MBP1988496.1 DNA-binding CsgD family transcriptional regulator [Paenibacillus eucommiae]
MNMFTTQIKKTIVEMSHLFSLTPRESEIILLLSLYGHTNKKLAEILFVSEKTLKNHIANIQFKTNSSSTRHLLSMVINFQAEATSYQYNAR